MHRQSRYHYCLSFLMFIFCLWLTLHRISQIDLSSILTHEEISLFENSFVLLKGIPLLVEICMYGLNLFILALIYKFIKLSLPFSFTLLLYMTSNTISKFFLIMNLNAGILSIIFWGIYLTLLFTNIKDRISIKQGCLLLVFPFVNILLSFL